MTTNVPEILALLGPSVLEGIPLGPDSTIFIVNPSGSDSSDSNHGLHPDAPLLTITEAEDRCTSGNNDCVLVIGGATGDTLTETLVWDKDYTHLKGVSSPLPGLGQRCRLLGGATSDVTEVLTWASDGSVCMNMQIFNGADADVDSGAVTVSGHRNAFINCMISGMGHETPAARAGSYSLTVSGVENHFLRCYIGLDTITRAEANAELVISGSKDSYWDCTIASFSDTAGHFAMKVPGAGTHTFKGCLIHNMSTNNATALTDAINNSCGTTHTIAFDPQCMFIGYTGIADVVTNIYCSGPAPNAGFGLSTNPSG